MSSLVVITFDDEYKAFELRALLAKMQREYLREMEDAAQQRQGRGTPEGPFRRLAAALYKNASLISQ